MIAAFLLALIAFEISCVLVVVIDDFKHRSSVEDAETTDDILFFRSMRES